MTNTVSSVAIAAEIEALRDNLSKVSATIELLGEPAFAKAVQIDAAIKEALERFASALADEVIADRNRRLSAFTDIQVICPDDDRNLVSAPYTIKYTRNVYDLDLKAATPKVHTINGFASLPDEAFEYLINRKPEAIPAAILALAPNDPHAAFDIYFAGKRRGYIKLPVAA